MVKRAGIRAVEREAEAVADHGADQGAFDVANGKRHAEPGLSADRPYQSRQAQSGKRGGLIFGALAVFLAPAFCAAAWQRSATLAILTASSLLWLVPVNPRWWPRQEHEETSPAARSASDLALVAGCWILATWALWQHRMLPLAVCAGAAALVLYDVASRPEAPPPRCVPERTRRRRAPRTESELPA